MKTTQTTTTFNLVQICGGPQKCMVPGTEWSNDQILSTGHRPGQKVRVEVQDPTEYLLSLATEVAEKYVRTCNTSNCGCMSHDSGYNRVTITLPVEVAATIYRFGGSVHCHAQTCLAWGDRGVAAMEWRRRKTGNWDGASQAERVLDLVLDGKTLAAARQQVEREEKHATAVARREKRRVWVDLQTQTGLTEQEANLLYGAGPFTKEVDWAERKPHILKMGPHVLNAIMTANSGKAQSAAGADELFGRASFPRTEAWARYALKAFFPEFKPRETVSSLRVGMGNPFGNL